jgi:hypothetical protein
MSLPDITLNGLANPGKKPKKEPAMSLKESNYKVDRQTGEYPGNPTFVPKRFNPQTQIPLDATMVFFGKRRTGKSFMCRYLLFLMKAYLPYVLVFTKTKFNNFWQQYVPDRFIHRGYVRSVLAKLKAIQEKVVTKIMSGELKETMKPQDHRQVNPYKAVVFDDVISDGEILKRDMDIVSLFTEGRHLKLPTFFCTQYAKGVSTVMRGNVDLAFIFKQGQRLQKESIAEDFISMLDKREAMAIIDKYCQGFQCLVIDTASTSTAPEDVLFVFTAEDPGKFKLGCKQFWEGPGAFEDEIK